MARFRFIHAADLHLDTPFQGVAAPAPAIRQALLDASLDAWDDLVALTIAENAAFLVIAGDVYDGAARGMRAQFRFLRGLQRLATAGVMVFIVHGNHDPLDEGWSGIRAWPEPVVLFPSNEVTTAPAVRDGVKLATVHGISYAHRGVRENLAVRFPRPSAGGFHIALLHCNADNSPEHGAYSPCAIAELRESGYDYWALGHIHKRQSLGDASVAIEYPGNLQGRSPKASEQGAKGALVIDVDESHVHAVRFAPCDRVRFVSCQVDVTALADVSAVRDSLLSRLADLQTANAKRGLLVRAHLVGRGAVHSDLQQADAAAALLDELRQVCATESPFVWWESLHDDTRPEIDRQAIRQAGDLSAEVLRVGDRLKSDAQQLRQFLATAFSPLSARLLPEELRDINDEAARELIARGEDALLDMRERD
ncbi:MAG: metallophosphoesterase family protein [Thermoleophilia bacterium]